MFKLDLCLHRINYVVTQQKENHLDCSTKTTLMLDGLGTKMGV